MLRLARLSPLHLLTTLPFVLYALYKINLNYLKLALNIFFLQSWVPSDNYYFSFNAPSWSLSNEMFFYFCFFPLVLLRPKSLFKIFILLLATISLGAFFVDFFYPGQKFFGSLTIAHWIFYIFPVSRLLEFILGMLLFQLWDKKLCLPSWIILPSYLLLLASMYFAKEVPEPFRMSLFFLPFITLFFYSHLADSGLFIRFFSTKIIVLLGKASFAFYLIHQPLIDISKRILAKYDFSNFSFFLFSYTFISILSVATYILFERRVESRLRSLINEKVR